MPVQYDNRGKVIKPYTEHAWTQEMVLEVAKCAKSVKYFALNHCRVVHPVQGIIPLEMRPYQMEMLELLDKNQKCIFMLGRQMGKCVFYDTYIKLRNKKTGEEKLVKIGEFYEECNKNY